VPKPKTRPVTVTYRHDRGQQDAAEGDAAHHQRLAEQGTDRDLRDGRGFLVGHVLPFSSGHRNVILTQA
jgi:hypothetical protein